MKRIIAFLLVCMMVLVAGACSGGKDVDPTQVPSENPAVTPTEVPSEDPTEAPSETPTEAPTEAPTAEPSEDTNAVKDMSESLVISLTYDANGAVSNGAADGPELKAYNNNTIATEKNTETGKWQSNLNGGSDFYMASLVDFYDYMQDAFTLEFRFKFTEAPASPYCGVVDNCEAGGFGFELHPDPNGSASSAILKWNLYIDGAYILQDIAVNIDTWYHVIVSWDGCFSNIYINGELADSYDTMYGFIGFTSIETAKHLAIGACCSQDNSGGAGFVGAISLCNLYIDSVNDATAADLYGKI